MKKACQKCACYLPYYSKWSFLFWTEKRGFCSHCRKVTGEDACCKFFRPPHEPAVTIKTLDSAIEDLLILKRIFGVED